METRPDTFTITNFWIDWAVMPFMLDLGGLTVYWGVRDWHTTASIGSALPGWLASLPLMVSAPGFVLLGLSMLVTEPYWEHRGLWLGQALLIAGCVLGVAAIASSLLQGDKSAGVGGTLCLIGLLTMAALLLLPAFFVNAKPESYNSGYALWFGLLIFATGFLIAGRFMGYPFIFPQFTLGMCSVYAFGLGLMEVCFRRISFNSLLYIWDFRLGFEMLTQLPEVASAPLLGAVKILLSIAIGIVLFAVTR